MLYIPSVSCHHGDVHLIVQHLAHATAGVHVSVQAAQLCSAAHRVSTYNVQAAVIVMEGCALCTCACGEWASQNLLLRYAAL